MPLVTPIDPVISPDSVTPQPKIRLRLLKAIDIVGLVGVVGFSAMAGLGVVALGYGGALFTVAFILPAVLLIAGILADLTILSVVARLHRPGLLVWYIGVTRLVFMGWMLVQLYNFYIYDSTMGSDSFYMYMFVPLLAVGISAFISLRQLYRQSRAQGLSSPRSSVYKGLMTATALAMAAGGWLTLAILMPQSVVIPGGLARSDNEIVRDMQMLPQYIESYYLDHEALPPSLAVAVAERGVKTDDIPASRLQTYEFKPAATGGAYFICVTYKTATSSVVPLTVYDADKHPAGHYCLRSKAEDDEASEDLNYLKDFVQGYVSQFGKLPKSLDDVYTTQLTNGGTPPKKPARLSSYVYKPAATGGTFDLCTNFTTDTTAKEESKPATENAYYHKAGYVCTTYSAHP